MRDGTLRASYPVTCELETAGGVGIQVAGFGTADVIGGPIIYLEHSEEAGLRLFVWHDITTEEPLVVSLEKARETPGETAVTSTAAPT